MAKKMPSFGSQGTAAPVNTAQPIKAGVPTSTDQVPGGPGEIKTGVHSGGTNNNDKRKAK